MGKLLMYGLVSGLRYHKFKLAIYPTLIIAMVWGLIIYDLFFPILFLNYVNLQASR